MKIIPILYFLIYTTYTYIYYITYIVLNCAKSLTAPNLSSLLG